MIMTLEQFGFEKLPVGPRHEIASLIEAELAPERGDGDAPLTPAQLAELARGLAFCAAHPKEITPWELVRDRHPRTMRLTRSGSPQQPILPLPARRDFECLAVFCHGSPRDIQAGRFELVDDFLVGVGLRLVLLADQF